MLNLQEAVYEKMNELCDNPAQIIYENHEVNERVEIETYIVIVKIRSFGFRVYQGMLHSDGEISVKFMGIDNDMFNTMTSKLHLGEVETDEE